MTTDYISREVMHLLSHLLNRLQPHCMSQNKIIMVSLSRRDYGCALLTSTKSQKKNLEITDDWQRVPHHPITLLMLKLFLEAYQILSSLIKLNLAMRLICSKTYTKYNTDLTRVT